MSSPFHLESHDSAFDDSNPPFESTTSVRVRKELFALGWGETYRGMVTARVLVFQKPGGPLWRSVTSPTYPHELWRTASETAFNTDASAQSVRAAFKEAMQKRLFARAFFLNENDGLRKSGETAHSFVLLTQQGWGEWRSLRQASECRVLARAKVGFWWTPDSEDLFFAPSGELWHTLRPQLEIPDSPLHFARHWAQSPNIPDANGGWVPAIQLQTSFIWKWKHGSQTELETALRNLFLSQTKWWQTPRHLQWHINLKERSEERVSLDGDPKPRRTPSFGKALEQIWNYFDPTPNLEVQKKHLEAKRLYENGWQAIHITIREPTMHEQLEAALCWREWQKETK